MELIVYYRSGKICPRPAGLGALVPHVRPNSWDDVAKRTENLSSDLVAAVMVMP